MILRETSQWGTPRVSVLKLQRVSTSLSWSLAIVLMTWLWSALIHLCIPGETGLLVSKITDIAPFVGYANNQQQTEKKKLRNVFKKGDLYFNSGDLLRIDWENFIYFQDRVGDTFRFKTLLPEYAKALCIDRYWFTCLPLCIMLTVSFQPEMKSTLIQ